VAVMSSAICVYKTLTDSPRLVRRATGGLKNSKNKAEEAINLYHNGIRRLAGGRKCPLVIPLAMFYRDRSDLGWRAYLEH
jgi:hypothetical protein